MNRYVLLNVDSLQKLSNLKGKRLKVYLSLIKFCNTQDEFLLRKSKGRPFRLLRGQLFVDCEGIAQFYGINRVTVWRILLKLEETDYIRVKCQPRKPGTKGWTMVSINAVQGVVPVCGAKRVAYATHNATLSYIDTIHNKENKEKNKDKEIEVASEACNIRRPMKVIKSESTVEWWKLGEYRSLGHWCREVFGEDFHFENAELRKRLIKLHTEMFIENRGR